jgi:hypothetical protein
MLSKTKQKTTKQINNEDVEVPSNISYLFEQK